VNDYHFKEGLYFRRSEDEFIDIDEFDEESIVDDIEASIRVSLKSQGKTKVSGAEKQFKPVRLTNGKWACKHKCDKSK
jgi:hypothetical protein